MFKTLMLRKLINIHEHNIIEQKFQTAQMLDTKQKFIIDQVINLFRGFPQPVLNTILIHASNLVHLFIQVFGRVGRCVFYEGLFSFLPMTLCVGTTARQRIRLG